MNRKSTRELDALWQELENQLQATGTGLETVARLREKVELEQAKAIEALQEREEQLRLFAEHAPAALAMLDRQMRYLCYSRRWLKDYGLNGLDLRGLSHYQVFPEIPERWREVHRRALAGEVIRAEEDRFERADGSVQWLRWEVLPWRNSAGVVAGIVMFTEDITERKLVEEELHKAKDELEVRVQKRTEELSRALDVVQTETRERIQAVQELRRQEQLLMQQNRQVAMGEMISNIAHQWRQPLNLLGLLVQGLEFHYRRGEFSAELLHETTQEAMRVIQQMSKTIDEFRNFFLPDPIKAVFEINAVVATTVSLLDAAFRAESITVRVIDEKPVYAEGYPNQFSHVILNLLLNAKEVLLQRGIQDPAVTLRIFREGDHGAVTVTDNAGGIPDEILERIFDPYFSTKGPEKGTGIGLFMSKTIIERSMGGSLTVRNTAEGAEFKVLVQRHHGPK